MKTMKQLQQALNTIIQYDIGDRHFKIEVSDEQLKEPATYRVIRNRAKRWALGEL